MRKSSRLTAVIVCPVLLLLDPRAGTRNPLASAVASAQATAVVDQASSFDFSETLRIDYFHRGGPGGERVEFDRLYVEGEWPGSRTQLVDSTGLGKFFFDLVDRASGRVLYSRGFSSIYGEWETTPAFRKGNQYFHESIRFPRPVAPFRVVLKKRTPENQFDAIWTTELDPRTIAQRDRSAGGSARVSALSRQGDPATKVDLLLMSEGYAADELQKFRADAARLMDAMFSLEPFRSRRADFNVHLLEAAGSPLSVEYNVLGLERYLMTLENGRLRNRAAAAPYDVLAILVNNSKYGGGGIFNQQTAVAASNEYAEYTFVHELAHNLAGLGDEYVGSVPYETGTRAAVEPWEPNLTALLDPATLKWRDLVEPGTPIPTPMSYAGRVGVFEGAGYEARGLYRPEAECIMGTRKLVDFCRVCQRAIGAAIDLHTR